MKNKFVYIIAALLLTALLLIQIEIRHQSDVQQIAALTGENATLAKQNNGLSQTVEGLRFVVERQEQDIAQLTNEIEQLKVQPPKVPEAQKTNRSADRPRYNLTDAERDLIERVVMAESGGESYEGQILVCQCILNACEIDGIRPAKVIKKYVYAKGRPKPTDSVVRAVSAVFDKGETVTDEPIVYFYAPGLVRSEFHEAQRFVLMEGNHKFFAEREG